MRKYMYLEKERGGGEMMIMMAMLSDSGEFKEERG